MAEPVTMPQLGESVTEGTITRWLKAEGETIEQDEPLAEVDTDKVNTELPSPLAGTVQRLLVPEGTTVDVGTEIALVATGAVSAKEPAEAPPRENAASAAPTEEFPAAHTEAQPVAAGGDGGPRVSSRSVDHGGGRGGNGRAAASGGAGAEVSAEELKLRRSSPVVRRIAAEHGLEIGDVPGTGTGGRVTKKDIEGFVGGLGTEEYAPPGLREEREHFAPPESEEERVPRPDGPRAARPEPTPGRVPDRAPLHDGDRVVGLTGIRRAIANRMTLSKAEIPHAWTLVEVDVSGLVALREGEKAAFAGREGVKLTYLPFIVEAAVAGLKEQPVLNSVWDGDRIIVRKAINVGIAVDLEDALIVPVLRDADGLNLVGLARGTQDLVRRAREGRLSTEDVSGGTFTVNNPGSLGSVASTPIINHPQAAILQAEAIVKRPVVVESGNGNDAIAVRSMMNLEVSFDHRILDGGVALKFLNAVKRRLEAYGPEGGLE